MGSIGFGKFRIPAGNIGVAILPKLASLDGLVLDAVRDEQAVAAAAAAVEGCSACNSGLTVRTVQLSWCSMKLSTLRIIIAKRHRIRKEK